MLESSPVINVLTVENRISWSVSVSTFGFFKPWLCLSFIISLIPLFIFYSNVIYHLKLSYQTINRKWIYYHMICLVYNIYMLSVRETITGKTLNKSVKVDFFKFGIYLQGSLCIVVIWYEERIFLQTNYNVLVNRVHFISWYRCEKYKKNPVRNISWLFYCVGWLKYFCEQRYYRWKQDLTSAITYLNNLTSLIYKQTFYCIRYGIIVPLRIHLTSFKISALNMFSLIFYPKKRYIHVRIKKPKCIIICIHAFEILVFKLYCKLSYNFFNSISKVKLNS